MISLRYHVVSIAACFLALAVGVVLGSTALNGTLLSGLAGEKKDLGSQVSDLEAQRNALNARLADADAFAGSMGPKVVAGALDKRSVV
ncbi:copper transporter, partial [Amycolatopsis lexingtonensis]